MLPSASGGVMELMIGAGPWRVGAKWGSNTDFLSDFGSFCVRTISAAVLLYFFAFQPNRVGMDESSMTMWVTRFSVLYISRYRVWKNKIERFPWSENIILSTQLVYDLSLLLISVA